MAGSNGKNANTNVSLLTHHKRNIAFTCTVTIMARARGFEDIKTILNFLVKTKTPEILDTCTLHLV
jgi:hypothetical protein